MKRIGLVSDTHGMLRPEVVAGLEGVESILHLGDVGSPEILTTLSGIAPVRAVRGNVDRGPWANALPETLVVDLFGVQAYLLHDRGMLDLDPRAADLRFVFYGHTHRPDETEWDGVRYVNPGSIGPRRFDLPISYALLHEDLRVEFVDVTGA
jgi:putative phosphoesterase